MKQQTLLFSKDQYFEAIIQLRPAKEEILRFIQNQIKKRKSVQIQKIVKLKTGIDIYLTSQKFARSIGQRIKKSFKGELKITKKLHSRDKQTSKDIYRATVLFRPKV